MQTYAEDLNTLGLHSDQRISKIAGKFPTHFPLIFPKEDIRRDATGVLSVGWLLQGFLLFFSLFQYRYITNHFSQKNDEMPVLPKIM
jgi:hypothetical protein